MDFLLEALTNWLKEMLVGGIMSNLSGMFDSVNQQVADISVQVGQTPQGWNGSIFNMIENLSNSIMVPIRSRSKRPLPALTARTKKENLRRTVSLMNGCGRTESAAYRTATTQRPSSFRTSTISFPKTKIRRQSLRVGVISSIILTARFISSCLF